MGLLAHSIRQLCDWHHEQFAIDLLDWATAHGALHTRVGYALKLNKQALKRLDQYASRLVNYAAPDAPDLSEARACALQLLEADRYKSGGSEVELITGGYDAMLRQDWAGARFIFEKAMANHDLDERTKRMLQYLTGLLALILRLPEPGRRRINPGRPLPK